MTPNALIILASALDARAGQPDRLIDRAARRAIETRNPEAAEGALAAVFAFGVHVEGCAYLHPMIDDSNRDACTCWMRQAELLLQGPEGDDGEELPF